MAILHHNKSDVFLKFHDICDRWLPVQKEPSKKVFGFRCEAVVSRHKFDAEGFALIANIEKFVDSISQRDSASITLRNVFEEQK